jgi:hypothetical protein
MAVDADQRHPSLLRASLAKSVRKRDESVAPPLICRDVPEAGTPLWYDGHLRNMHSALLLDAC